MSESPWHDGDHRQTAILLVGHGTQEHIGRVEFFRAANHFRRLMPDMMLRCAFLELARPGIEESVQRLLRRGVKRIIVVPAILFSAAHVKYDIPAAIRSAIGGALVEVFFTSHLGCAPELLRLSQVRRDAAMLIARSDDSLHGSSHALLMVGRGAKDPDAIAEMHAFVRASAVHMPGWTCESAFYAMAQPHLSDALHNMARSAHTILIQPHLLFSGKIELAIAAIVNDFRTQYPAHRFILARPLGPHPLLAKAMLRRLQEVKVT